MPTDIAFGLHPEPPTYESRFIQHEIRSTTQVNGEQISTKKSVKVPILEKVEATEQFILFIMAFDKLADRLHFQENGETLFREFEDQIDGTSSAITTWQSILQQHENEDRTAALFRTCISELFEKVWTIEVYGNLLDNIKKYRKPLSWTVQEFSNRIERLNLMSAYLPGAPEADPGLTSTELTKALIQAMPVQWQANLRALNKSAANSRYNEIFSLLEVYESYDDKSQASRKKKQHRHHSSTQDVPHTNATSTETQDNRHSRRRQFTNRSSNRRNSSNSSNRHNGTAPTRSTASNRIQSSDPCPLPGHGSHTWGQCFQNAANPNRRDNSNRHTNRSGATNNAAQDANIIIEHEEETCISEGEDCFVVTRIKEHELQEPLLYDGVPNRAKISVHRQNTQDKAPQTLAKVEMVGDVKSTNNMPYLLRALFDSGCKSCLANLSNLPKDIQVFTRSKKTVMSTAAGTFESLGYIKLTNMTFPEMSPTRKFTTIVCQLFDEPTCPYGLILGRDFLRTNDFSLDFSNDVIKWGDDCSIPFHEPGYLFKADTVRKILEPPSSARFRDAEREYEDAYNTAIQDYKDANYFQANLEDIVREQHHLDKQQQQHLLKVLSKFENSLFSGRLGRYTKSKVHLQVKKNAKPFHCRRPYPIPQHHQPAVKKEISRLVELGVMEPYNVPTSWGHPILVVPKKDGSMRWCYDARKLNEALERSYYPMESIKDILQRQLPFNFFTTLDVSMQFYCFELDEASKELCIQAAMTDSLLDILDDLRGVYMDDVGLAHLSFAEHMRVLEATLQRLADAGFTINPAKCKFAQPEVEWLGYLFTKEGVQPWPKKVAAIQAIAQPKNKREIRRFIGMISFYRDLWRNRAHVLAPLHQLAARSTSFQWLPRHTQAFEEAKAIISKTVLLYYPDPNKAFVIDTDSSDLQLGAVISQEGNPVAFFSRRLTAAQSNYSVGEKELLSVVETLVEYRTLLFGRELIINTDHLNNTYSRTSNPKIHRWMLYISTYGPTIQYKKGSENIVADALSRLEIRNQDPLILHSNEQALDALMVLPAEPFPLSFDAIAAAQENDDNLQRIAPNNPSFKLQEFYGVHLWTRRTRASTNTFLIVLPQSLLIPAINWFHTVSAHAGAERLELTLRQHFFAPQLGRQCTEVVRACDVCQRYKDSTRGYSHLPPRNDSAMPFSDVSVDLIGPWTIQIGNREVKFHALHVMDNATTLSEYIRIPKKTSSIVSEKFNQSWLSRYPKPVRCIHDQGGEFTGPEFQFMLQNLGIKSVPITVRNPQGNSLNERQHRTAQNMIRIIVNAHPPEDLVAANDIVDSVLASVAYASRTAVHRTFNTSPGNLVFNRDMLLPLPLESNFESIRLRRQQTIDKNNVRENKRRWFHDYAPGDEVLINTDSNKRSKLGARTIGPFRILRCHTNGTVTIQRSPTVIERINVRLCRPYFRTKAL
jgi:transposase InsO family protein